MRSAVPHQVEFHIPATPVQLEPALALAMGRVLAPGEDRHVGAGERVADGLHHREAGFESTV